MSTTVPVLIVHGGAQSNMCGIPHKDYEDGVKAAAQAGYAKLTTGGTAVDAVETAVLSLEFNPVFNAGYGSCLTIDGRVEMDASIMDGSTLEVGAVAGVSNVQNPIQLARMVMSNSDHVLLAGEGAQRFAEKQGIPFFASKNHITNVAKTVLQEIKGGNHIFKNTIKTNKPSAASGSEAYCLGHDTVGAVAMDLNGHVASANSTGGILGKLPGRVGDCPLIGAGGYSDDHAGAIVTTGHGESFIKMGLSKHASILMEQGMHPQATIEKLLENMLGRVGGRGGAIALNIEGDTGVSFNTPIMPWCSIKSNQLTFGVSQGEQFEIMMN